MFAIRQKSTKYFLPNSGKRKGFTWDEPEKDCIPRLFKRRCDASSALNKWLKGRQMYMYTHVGATGNQPGDWCIDVVQPVKPRNRDDMEVIQVAIISVEF